MFGINRTLRAATMAFFSSLWCTSPVWADDTEIFFGEVEISDIRPNILFILDTSGSMSANVAGTGGDRLDNVKEAMFTLLEELNNVNVGLMRFSTPGGPVLYPVSNIDDVVPDTNVELEVSVATSSDDAQEFAGTGEMFLDRPGLQIVETTNPDVLVFQDQISATNDDAEEFSDGTIDTVSNGDFLFDGASLIGVKFSGSSVPPGANIRNAYLRFNAIDGDTAQVSYQIFGQTGLNDVFTTTASSISTRPVTTASVDWLITEEFANDEWANTPDVTAIVQELVNEGTWNPGGGGEDDMVFILRPHPTIATTGQRRFRTRNASTTRAPELVIEYQLGTTVPVTDLSRVGLRFQNLRVPRGATVTEAFITFTSDQDFVGESFNLTIDAEADGNPATYSSAAGDMTARSLIGAPVNWSRGSFSRDLNRTYDTPDLTAMVSAVTSRPDWCGGNPIAFQISGAAGSSLPAWSADGNGSLAPRLTVRYDYDTTPDGTSCQRRRVFKRVQSRNDDADEDGTVVSLQGGDLTLTSSSEFGVRFRDLDIPRNATINEAYLEFVAAEAGTGTVNAEVSAEAADNALSYATGDGSIQERSYNTPATAWTITDAWAAEDTVRTSNIADQVSAVVSRAGWSLRNNMTFRVRSTSGSARQVVSFDGRASRAPRLVVDFQDDGSGIQERRVRSVLADVITGLNHNGLTPVQDTLYEAARYYTGQDVLWGLERGNPRRNYTRVSAAGSMVDGTYTISRPSGCTDSNLDAGACRDEVILGAGGSSPKYQTPITSSCQRESHIIMLTDGFANGPNSAALIPDFIGEACANEPTVVGASSFALSTGEQCVKSLAKYIRNNDMNSSLDDDQTITTHTIGFNFSNQWLADVAEAGGGVYKEATSAIDLVEEIQDIVGNLLPEDTSFVAPVAAVNEFNQLEHLDQVYFAVFSPDELPRWRGNVKRYKIDGDGVFRDSVGNEAINSSTGFFTTTSQSFWSSIVDGASIELGGAAENVPSDTLRKIYTYYAGSTSDVLSNSVNLVTTTNTNLTQAMFDVTTTAEDFTDLIQWVRGRDVDDEDGDGSDTDSRYAIGDPLHSRPVAVTYGGTEADPDVELFFGTNSGALHSVSARDGTETFAFIPEAMLPLQSILRANEGDVEHPYGLDDTPTVWQNDEDRDGIDPADVDDFVRLYIGMRRGGRNYYALDLTDRSNPKVMFELEGGQIQSNGDDLRELGQTWSRPIKTQIILDGDSAPRDVLIFSAGYDPSQDEATLQTADSVGRGFYIVDAISGDLIWSGGKTGAQAWDEEFANMDYSFPDSIAAIDLNVDGLADMWFAGDTGGRVWRFDINNGQPLADLVTGGVIADVGVAGGANVVSENRRFFATPSVALQRNPETNAPQLVVVIASGFRPSPLSTLAVNQLYAIRQNNVFSAPGTYTAITEADLTDVTGTTPEAPLSTSVLDAFNASAGWFARFPRTAEKALASPLIIDSSVVVSTYTPGVRSPESCDPTPGASRGYTFDLANGELLTIQDLATVGIIGEAGVFVTTQEDAVLDPNAPSDANDPNDEGSACASGSTVAIKLNAEDGPVDAWCNDSRTTYWQKEQ
ncbi:MAG: PilC/PilY family type IV pilus protein [Pseudomonadota bacterium]